MIAQGRLVRGAILDEGRRVVLTPDERRGLLAEWDEDRREAFAGKMHRVVEMLKALKAPETGAGNHPADPEHPPRDATAT